MEAILYCDKCFEHFGLLKNAKDYVPDALHLVTGCGGAIKAHKPVYAGVFFDQLESARLLTEVAPIHPKVHAHHLTLAYGRHMAEKYPLGRKMRMDVYANVYNSRGQCVLVSRSTVGNLLAENQKPHITISCAEGILPAYSNELINLVYGTTSSEEKLETIPLAFLIEGVVDYHPRLVK